MILNKDSFWNTLYKENSVLHPSQTHFMLFDLKDYKQDIIHRFPKWSCFFTNKSDVNILLGFSELKYILTKLIYIFVPHREMKLILSNLYPKLQSYFVVLYKPIQYDPSDGFENTFTKHPNLDDELTFMKYSLDCIEESLDEEKGIDIICKCLTYDTPILLKRKPAYEEYLGIDYPLFIDNIDNHTTETHKYMSKIPKTKHYLKTKDKRPFSIDSCSRVIQDRINRINQYSKAKKITWIVPCISTNAIQLKNYIYSFMKQKKNDVSDTFQLHFMNIPKSHAHPELIQSILSQSSITYQNIEIKHSNIKHNDIYLCYKEGLSFIDEADYVFCSDITIEELPNQTLKNAIKSFSTSCDAILFHHHGHRIQGYLDMNNLWNMKKEKTCMLWRKNALVHIMNYYDCPMNLLLFNGLQLGYSIKSVLYDIEDPLSNNVPTGSFNDPFFRKSIKKQLELFHNPDKIPRVVYKTGPLEYKNLSKNIKELFRDTLLNNPELSIDYFDDTRCILFLKRYFPESILETYFKLKPGAYKADFFRFCILYIQGGVYSDLSQNFRVPIEHLVDFEKDTLVLVDDIVVPPHTQPGIQINFMASRPRNPLFLSAIQKTVENVSHQFYGYTPLDPTGPYMFSKIYYTSNISARIDLVQIHHEKGSYVVFKNNIDKIAYDNKSSRHDENIKKTYENSYDTLWRRRDIYS